MTEMSESVSVAVQGKKEARREKRQTQHQRNAEGMHDSNEPGHWNCQNGSMEEPFLKFKRRGSDPKRT